MVAARLQLVWESTAVKDVAGVTYWVSPNVLSEITALDSPLF